ncbi:hypothetical protein LXL04_028263 [Taraxacum kok-saghyz]
MEGGWKRVSRRSKNKEIISFYVTNLPADVTVTTLRKAFHSYGKIVDVYIPGRKDKSGSFFAFVRFEGVQDTVSMVDNLNKVRCGNCIVKTNVARYERRRETAKTSKSYTRPAITRQPQIFRQNAGTTRTWVSFVAAVSGPSDAPPTAQPPPPPSQIPPVQLKPVNSMVSCNNQCLIGEVKEFQMLSDIPKLLKIDGQTPARSYYTGGLKVILKFSCPTAAENYLQEEHKWNRWFKCMKSGFIEEVNQGRLAMVKIIGLPTHLRSEENVTAIASRFGKVLEADGHN